MCHSGEKRGNKRCLWIPRALQIIKSSTKVFPGLLSEKGHPDPTDGGENRPEAQSDCRLPLVTLSCKREVHVYQPSPGHPDQRGEVAGDYEEMSGAQESQQQTVPS